MNHFLIVIKRYWFFSIVVIIGLMAAEIFMTLKIANAPFGMDARMDTRKMEDLYWPVRYEDGDCQDCPKKWWVDGVKLHIPFMFEDPNIEGLKWVKEQVYHAVVDYQSNFDLALQLMDYIHKRTEYASSDKTYNTHIELIKDVLKGGEFWCGSISKTLMTASLSLGRNARLIHFQTAPDFAQDYLGHYAVEIWLSELKKWVLFDPTLNVHYLYQGQPASTLEVHRAYINGKARDIKVVKEKKLSSLETFNDKPFSPEVLLKEYFTHFQVIFRNDFLENGDHVRTTNKETINYYLNWVDEKTPAFYFRQELPAFGTRIGVVLFNGIIIVFLLVGLFSNKTKK